MAFQNCTGVAAAEVFYVWQGQRCENVFHVRKDTPWTSTELNYIAGQLLVWATDHWAPVAISSASVVGVRAIDLSTELGGVAEPSLAEPIPGAMAPTNVPTNVTVAVAFRTAFRGRSFRGRAYHVGLSLAHILDSHLTVAGQIAIQAAYASLISLMASSAGVLCVLSRRHDKALRPVGLGYPVTAVTLDTSLDSQRRRLPDRGI